MSFNVKKEKTIFFNEKLEYFFQLKILPVILFFLGFVAMSPVLSHLGWRGIYSILIAVFICSMFVILSSIRLKNWFIYIFILTLLTGSFTSFYWGDIRFIFGGVFLIGSLFVLQFANDKTIEKMVDLASIFVLLVLVGAVIGFAFAFLGGAPLFDFLNPDGRPNFFFYTTLSNAVFGSIIRPAGIYDEPGALSLYVCAIAAIRHLTGRNNRFTWILLLLGFITLSLAHLIYVFFHIAAERLSKKNILFFLTIFSVALVLIFSTGFNEVLSGKLFHRLMPDDASSTIAGDNRSSNMINAIELMSNNAKIYFFGAHPSCRFDYFVCQKLFPPIAENPLFPIFSGGIFVSWQYYLALFVFLSSPLFGKIYLVAFGFGLLLLQRPDMLSLSSAMISSLLVFIVLNHGGLKHQVQHRVY